MRKIEERPITTVSIRSFIAAAIISLLLFVLFKNQSFPYIFGFSYGILVSLVGFYLLSFSVIRAVEMDESKAKGYSSMMYALRIVIYAVLLSLAAFINQIDLLSAILGTFIVRFIIQIDYFIGSVRKMKL
jgi:glucan phosphoethanolaminetransferase (alkaline phosphatase superfamily)